LSLRRPAHLPEYALEAALLGTFMFVACVLGVLLEHPAAAARAAIPDPFARRALFGAAMAATALALVYSPWGKRSGAHLNPAVTLAFLRLGRVRARDAAAYVAAQALGAIAGVLAAWAVIGSPLAHADVRFVVTRPGAAGATVAFVSEAVARRAMLDGPAPRMDPARAGSLLSGKISLHRAN
jgi:aquaporin Z